MEHFPGLYRRKNGLYGFAKQVNGVRKIKSLGTRDLSEAITLASQINGSPLNVSAAPISDLIDPYLAHKRLLKRYTEASCESKRAILQKFARFTAGADAVSVTKRIVQDFYNRQRSDGLADDTAASYLAAVRAFFAWCVDVQHIRRDNPCKGLQLARISPKARRNFCTPELVEKLINDCPRDDLKFVLFCGFHCGLRKNEIIEARPFWFDTANGQLHLRKHDGIEFKDREERSLPLTYQFVAFLKSYGMLTPYMLHPEVEKGKSLYRYDFERPFRDYMKTKGCEWVTTHIMRHTYASLLASAGESIFNIAVWLGDDVRVVQKHYAKLLPVKRDVGLAFRVASSAEAPAPSADSKAGEDPQCHKSQAHESPQPV
jgi:integrase